MYIRKGKALMGYARLLIGTALVALFVVGCGNGSTPSQPTTAQRTPAPTTLATPISTATVQTLAQCPLTQLQTDAYNSSGLKGIPWMRAQPASSGITAHLFYAQPHDPPYLHTGGQFPDDRSTKILWIIEDTQGGADLTVTGLSLADGHSTFQQTFQSVAGPPASQYPSIVTVPFAGCWQVTIQSGTISGTMVFWAIAG
jgi:hypothetical protein